MGNVPVQSQGILLYRVCFLCNSILNISKWEVFAGQTAELMMSSLLQEEDVRDCLTQSETVLSSALAEGDLTCIYYSREKCLSLNVRS